MKTRELMLRVLAQFEWAGENRGMGSGAMGSGGDGRPYPACPICHGLAAANGDFMKEVCREPKRHGSMV